MTEIPVTDAMMVRTLAEEVYTQIVGAPDGIHAAVLVTLPVLAVAIVAAELLIRWLSKRVPLNSEPVSTSRRLSIPAPWLAVLNVGVFVAVMIAFALPLSGADREMRQRDRPPASAAFAFEQFSRALTLNGRVLMQSLIAAAVSSRHHRGLAGNTAGLGGTHPGPATLGVADRRRLTGAHAGANPGAGSEVVDSATDGCGGIPFSQPGRGTGLPAAAFAALRSAVAGADDSRRRPAWLPVALLIVVPVIRAIPRDLMDLARLDGENAWRLVGRPATASATHSPPSRWPG